MPRPIDTAEWLKNWKAGMDGASQKYIKGVQSTDVDPMEKAANAQEKMKQGVIAAVDNGKYARGCRSVSKATWTNLCVNKGATRLSTGATEALPKMTSKIAAMAPKMDQLRSQIASMPQNTPAEREQRMLAWSRGMAQISAST